MTASVEDDMRPESKPHFFKKGIQVNLHMKTHGKYSCDTIVVVILHFWTTVLKFHEDDADIL